MKNSFLNNQEIEEIGFKKIGSDCLISKYASFYSPECITIGNKVRIDDFCILSGTIQIGSNVHISAYSALYGKMGITMEDYSGVSPRCTIFSAMDDFSGHYLIGPMVDQNKINLIGGQVRVSRYVQIGAGSIIFPNLIISEGTVVGAMSLVRESLEAWSIFAGIPVKKIRSRERDILLIENG